MEYLIGKLKEPSTWKGIIWMITAFGLWKLEPDQKEAIAAVGMTLAGLIGVFVEKGNAHTDEQIAKIASGEHQKRVDEILNVKKGKKSNAKSKKNDESSGGDFFGDSDGGDGGGD